MKLRCLALLALASCTVQPKPNFDHEFKSATKVEVTFRWRDKICQVVDVIKFEARQDFPDEFSSWTAAKFVDCGDGPIPANYDGGKAGLQ